MSNNNTIGERIKDLRKGKGWTQAVLAKKISVSDKAVSKWESGGGNPETSQLPILSELFGVTIDYLLTGKSNSTIVHMSKFELCAKNDDVDLLSEINNLGGQDENGQTFFQLICKYQSAKVFAKILADKNQYKLLPKDNTCGFMDYSTEILFLCVISNNIENIGEFGIEDISTLDIRNWLDESILALLIDERVANSTFDYVFSIHKKYSINNSAKALYQKIFESAVELYINDNNVKTKTILEKRIDFIINVFEDIAKQDMWRRENLNQFEYSYNKQAFINAISIPENTIKMLLNSKAFILLHKCQEINMMAHGFVIPDKEIEIEKMKANNKYSEEDILLQQVLFNGIVNIKELLKSKNYELIKKILTNRPIHYYELLYGWFNKKNYKLLFEFSVDYNFPHLAQALMEGGDDEIKDAICSTISELTSERGYNNSSNRSELQKVYNDNKRYIGNKTYSFYASSIKELESALRECREKIIKDLDFINLKNQSSGNLTKEHFENLLENNNLKLAIIDLCVKLESILKYQYRYEELTFDELLNKFCSNVLTTEEDDGWGYMTKSESYLIPLLHKLRKTRNNIVHPTNDCSDPITLDEFNTCLEYIFSIDKD